MKAIQFLYYCVAIIAAIVALWTYRSNSRRERAKWAVQLYDKFYETDHYKPIREKLDCGPDTAADVVQLATQESPEFTDYLNFFEMVSYLAKSKQLSKNDVLSLFQYYLQCLKKHDAVMTYLNNKENGFEQLRKFLRDNNLESTGP
ncbi:MAG TPA: hypothetical protein VMU92_06695 [Acidobacteriaceae bacterium]|nr:hypothetical protein [Acidobacteriaceae bacterium]